MGETFVLIMHYLKRQAPDEKIREEEIKTKKIKTKKKYFPRF